MQSLAACDAAAAEAAAPEGRVLQPPIPITLPMATVRKN